MTRLSFRLPEFTPRITWASPEARDVWQPRIAAVSAAWLKVERESVIAGVRPSALQHVTPEELPALMAEMAKHGLIVLPLGRTANANGYQSASRELKDGEPWVYRCAITRPERAADWTAAWAESNDSAIGILLGTPQCCRDFFNRVWKRERWMDTTVPMAEHRDFRTTRRASNTGLNLLWRWLGVRPVSHLPCSFYCAESLALAHKCEQLLPEPERTWHREILNWPVKYTSLRGIAEITSPIHRMSVPTDALSERVEIRYLGSDYPAEGAKGVDFPHKSTTANAVPLTLTRPSNPKDNGWSSLAAQNAAHRALLQAAPGPFRTVVDLGCGDGTLLSKIPAQRRVGIEHDAARARHARIDRVVVGDCTDRALVERVLAEEQPDLVIAQRDRNPPDTLLGYPVLSYSYEPNAALPQVLGAP